MMKKFVSLIATLFLVFSMVSPSLDVFAETKEADENVTKWQASKDIPTNKVWKITFNNKVNKNITLNEFVYVLDEDGNKVENTVAYDEEAKQLLVNPPEEGYKTNTTYKLVIDEGIQSTDNKKLVSTIEKEFTTANVVAVEEDSFEARDESKNELTLQENVKEVDSKEVIVPTNGETVTLVNDDNYQVGDIITLPATEDYPFGFFGKITSVEDVTNGALITLEETSLDQLIENFDISEQAYAEPIYLDEVDPTVSAKSARALGSFNNAVQFKNTKDGWKLIIEDLGFKAGKSKSSDKKKKSKISVSGEGELTLAGEISLTKPTITYDMDTSKNILNPERYYQPKDLGVKIKQSTDLTAQLAGKVHGKAEFPLAEMPLGIGIKLPKNLKAGILLKLTLVVEIDINGNITYTLKKSYTPSAGIKKQSNDKYKGYAKITPKGDGLKLKEAKVEADVDTTLNADVDLKLGSASLANISIDPSFNANIQAGTLYSTKLSDACYESNLDFNAAFSVSLIDINWKNIKNSELEDIYSYSIKPIQLLSSSTCSLEKIAFNQSSLSLNAGESKKLKVNGTINNKTEGLDLPNDLVTFKSSSSHVKVSTSGKVTAKKTAPNNHSATITVKYVRNGKTLTDKVKVTVSNVDTDDNGKDDEGKDQDKDDNDEPQSIADINYTDSYIITNDSKENVPVKLAAGTHYIIHNGTKITNSSVNASKYSNVNLASGEVMIASNLNEDQDAPTISDEHANVKVKVTKEGAFKGYTLYEGNTLKATNDSEANFLTYVADSQRKGAFSYVAYGGSDRIETFAVNTSISAINTLTAYSKGQIVITNEKEQPINVYIPNFNSTVEKDSKAALSYYDVAPGKSVKIESTNPIREYSSTGFKLTDETRKGSYDYVRYNASGTMDVFNTNNKLTSNYDTIFVKYKGETIVENTGDSTIQVYGPSRYLEVSSVSEKALSYYDIAPGKSVKIESTNPISAYSSTDFKIADETRKGKYDYVRYSATGEISNFNKDMKLTGTYESLLVSYKGETVVENTGDTTIQVYGPSRDIEVSAINESALSYYDLKPGQSVKVKSTEPIGVYSSTDFKIADETRKGKYDYVRYSATGEISNSKKDMKLTGTYESLPVSYKGETVVKNTGDTTIQVYGPSRYIVVY